MPSEHQKQQLSQTRSSVGWPKPAWSLAERSPCGRPYGGRRNPRPQTGRCGRRPGTVPSIGEAEASSGVADCPRSPLSCPAAASARRPGASWRLPAARDMPRTASVMTAWPRPSLTDLTKRDRTWRQPCFQSTSLARRASSSRWASNDGGHDDGIRSGRAVRGSGVQRKWPRRLASHAAAIDWSSPSAGISSQAAR